MSTILKQVWEVGIWASVASFVPEKNNVKITVKITVKKAGKQPNKLGTPLFEIERVSLKDDISEGNCVFAHANCRNRLRSSGEYPPTTYMYTQSISTTQAVTHNTKSNILTNKTIPPKNLQPLGNLD